jgi:hypothetical protein
MLFISDASSAEWRSGAVKCTQLLMLNIKSPVQYDAALARAQQSKLQPCFGDQVKKHSERSSELTSQRCVRLCFVTPLKLLLLPWGPRLDLFTCCRHKDAIGQPTAAVRKQRGGGLAAAHGIIVFVAGRQYCVSQWLHAIACRR